MEEILRIEELYGFKTKKDDWIDYDGFQITTTNQTIKIGISNKQCCCESFGCIITNDKTGEFIGSELKSVSIVDESLDKKKIDELEYSDCGGAMFVDLETSKGVLQFVAYNGHNGYYGHEAVLISKQLTKSTVI